MRHECEYRLTDELLGADGENLFLDAIVDGIIKYDDFYDAYLVFYYGEKKFLFWKRGICRVDRLTYCPYCGEKIYEERE